MPSSRPARDKLSDGDARVREERPIAEQQATKPSDGDAPRSSDDIPVQTDALHTLGERRSNGPRPLA